MRRCAVDSKGHCGGMRTAAGEAAARGKLGGGDGAARHDGGAGVGGRRRRERARVKV